MNTLAEDWHEYVEEVLPAGAPYVQRRETKLAFYAGAWSMLCTLREVGTDAVSEQQGIELLEALYQECMQFHRDVTEGSV